MCVRRADSRIDQAALVERTSELGKAIRASCDLSWGEKRPPTLLLAYGNGALRLA